MAIDNDTLAKTYLQIDMPVNDVVHLDMPYTDSVIDGQGVSFIHMRALPCPVGKTDPYDVRKVHADHSGCSNGFVYEEAGEIRCIFVGNSKQFEFMDAGLVTGSTVQVTVPRHYADQPEREVVFAIFDRLYLKQDLYGDATQRIQVVAAHLFEHNVGGMDRLKYPVNVVEHLIDSHGKRYQQGTDFDILGGQIRWNGTRQPGMDPATGKGEVCSVRYRYTPYWYVNHLIHEIRVVRSGDNAVRAPMTALIQREFAFENEQNDQGQRVVGNDDPRQATAPWSGSFGTR